MTWAMLSLMVVAGVGPLCNAGIVHHTYAGSGFEVGPGVGLDLDGDGLDDAGFDVFGPSGFPPDFAYYRNFLIRPEGTGFTTMYTSTRPVIGDVIGPASVMAQAVAMGASRHWHENPNGTGPIIAFEWLPGSPTDDTPAYIGYRVEDEAGVQRFGWLKYQLFDISQETFSVRVLERAHEDSGGPLVVGAIPSPALPALAASILPLLTRRRRR